MSSPAVLRVATFNAGLAVGVLPWATERLPHVVAALASLDADLLFVQEIWLEPHWERLRAAKWESMILVPRIKLSHRASTQVGPEVPLIASR